MKNMRKIIILSALLLITMMFVPMSNIFASPPKQKAESNEVGIYQVGVEIPLNRIILIHKKKQYCALKFTKTWLEMDEERLKLLANDIKLGGATAESARKSAEKKYADYESYFNKDMSLNLTTQNVQQNKGTASLLPTQGSFRPFIRQPGNGCVECGPIKLLWGYKTSVSFIPLGKGLNMRDYGIELAPTPWTDIKEVNVKDPRIKWYKYDEKRERIFIPIDKLWEK
jgi:hypothetical protein